MPKRTDIEKIMIIGAGPIVIGQACEFDYSGAQACKALKEEGYQIILVNSNPATIMTDPSMADATYIEPIIKQVLERIIEKERPHAILPTMGGQTALNAAMELHEEGILKKYNVHLIGAKAEVISKAEDRQKFRSAMENIGLACPRSTIVSSKSQALKILPKLELPVIIRPSFTLGGIGGGIAYNIAEFERIVSSGLSASPVSTVLIEESVLGWKEYELEVVRDTADNCIVVCTIENVDPMGIHTGDSITVAPAMTLTDKEYQILRDASIKILREIGVDTGGSNVQFAINPENGQLVVIEMNPRVSRSSALASKATGFPIAKIAAKLAVGYLLDELKNDITKTTPAAFEPTIDYVVTKLPRFTFEKFPGADPLLTTSMKSVGEVMAIGRCFEESLQKGLRSLETGLTGLNEIVIPGAENGKRSKNKDVIQAALSQPTSDRLRVIAQAFRQGLTTNEIQLACKYDRWFLERIRFIISCEEHIRAHGLPKEKQKLLEIKRLGFSDQRLGELTKKTVHEIAEYRYSLDINPVYKRVDSCAGEFPCQASYMYSTYENSTNQEPECESAPSTSNKIVILGGGPNRIGQGIEFDYCCVHGAYALKEAGYETIMVNCNPETVSTDYDTSDRLYFEPLTAEDVGELLIAEKKVGTLKGVIVQLGGQTPLKLAEYLQNSGINILGTSPESINLAEDREQFKKLINNLTLKQPDNDVAFSVEEAQKIVNKIGFPIVIRPSYVLGGRAMEIVHNVKELNHYMSEAVSVSGDAPVLLDKYIDSAIEVDVDALADGEQVYIAGIMQHIEEAGIHSGDSACSLPPYSLPETIVEQLKSQTIALSKALNVIGLVNIQFAIKNSEIYVLEVNPRASRTVPFVAKATGIPIARIAALLMAGEKLSSFDLTPRTIKPLSAVKEAIFPFSRFLGVDTILGPEMKSTGEVMGIDRDFEHAFAKSQLSAGMELPKEGTVFISVNDRDKPEAADIAKRLNNLGFKLIATGGTREFLKKQGLKIDYINKVLQGRPHCVDAIISGKIQLIINTTEGAQSLADSYSIRRTALTQNIPHYTTISAASAAVRAIEGISIGIASGGLDVFPLQAYFETSF